MDIAPDEFATTSSIKVEPISLEGMHEAVQAFKEKYRDVPNVLRVHPSTYKAIRIYFMEKEAEEDAMFQENGRYRLETTPYQQLLDVPIIIDHELNPGEWKFDKVVRPL